jgi:hypothetical protein
MALKDITITGSIGSYPTLSYGQKTYISSTDEQSFPIEQFTGSSGGATPNFNGQYSTTDLFVNVTQLWSGSIDTQAGIVDFTHDTQEEFINGEYSGSGIEVTHQRLIGEDCIQLLNVNTIPTNYKPFFYVAVNSTPFDPPDPSYVAVIDNFLNTNNLPNSGEIYILSTSYKIQTPGGGGISTIKKVTHIKVNKFDDSGNDNTLSLQELNSLRILFSDLGVVNFLILSITEYPTYYLYSTDETLPNGSLNSVDNNVLDYRFSASLSSVTINAFSIWDGLGLVSSIDARSYFDSNQGNYLFGDTPNIPIQFTASFNIGSGMGGYFQFLDFTSNSIIEQTPISAAGTYIISGSFYPIENHTYGLFIQNSNFFSSTINNIQWMFTQSANPNVSTNVTVLNPYLTGNFEYSDCNVLINNATNLEYDPNFYKVNYDTGLLIPTNQQQILDGTAEFAPVKPYNYSSNSQILPRYNGVRTTSNGFNLPSTIGFSNEQLSDINLVIDKGIPNVQSLNTVVAYVDGWRKATPERMNTSEAHIKYLINSDGTITIPNTSNIALFSNQNAFRSGERVIVSTQNQALPSDPYVNIVRGATTLTPIIYNQLRDTDNFPMIFTGSIQFTDNNPLSSATVKDFTANIQPSGFSQPITSDTFSGIFLNDIIYQGANIGTALNTTNLYTITQAIIDEIAIDSITFTATVSGVTYETYGIYLYAAIYRDNIPITSGYNSVLLDQYGVTKTFTFSVTVPRADFVVGHKYGIRLRLNQISVNTYYWGSQISSVPPTSLVVSTNPLASLPITSSGLFISSSYQDSSSFLFITNSVVSQYYRSSQPIRQIDLSGSLFSPIVSDFKFKKGDEFRFEGDEAKVFMIKNVNENAYYYVSGSIPLVSQSAVEIELIKPIAGLGIDTSEFLVRRYVDDASTILLEGFAPVNSTGPYIIRPEFITSELNNNINTYIGDLTEKGLI